MARVKYYLIPIAIAIVIVFLVTAINKAAASSPPCHSGSSSHTWGTWPFSQTITDQAYWCGYPGGPITYRTVHVGASSPVCSTISKTSFVFAGGGTKYWMDYEDEAKFKCPEALPGWYVYPDDKMAITIDTYGYYKNYWHS